MVIEPWEKSGGPRAVYFQRQEGSRPGAPGMADFVDRMAAASVDFLVVLAPVFYLATAPIRAHATYALLLSQNDRLLTLAIGAGLFAFLLTWLYVTLSTWRMGATFGQWLLGLRVLDTKSGGKVSLSQSAFRAFLFAAELMLAPWMLLSVHSHPERRCAHDRLADTAVVGIRRQGRPPRPWERGLVLGLFSALSVAFALGLVVAGLELIEPKPSPLQAKGLSSGTQERELCSEVDDAIKHRGLRATDSANRLEVALALFSAGLITKECLGLETSWQLETSGEDPAFYLAKAFVHLDEASISNEYLSAVCALGSKSEACWLARLVQSFNQPHEMVRLIQEGSEHSPAYVKVWLLRYARDHEKWDEVEKVAAELSESLPAVVPFLGVERAKLYWRRGELRVARALTESLLPTLDEWFQMDLAGWMCREELRLQCGSEPLACRWLAQVDWSEIQMQPEGIAQNAVRETALIAEVMREEACDQSLSHEARQRLKGIFQDGDLIEFLSAYADPLRMARLAMSHEVSDLLRTEAALRLGRMLKDADNLRTVSRGLESERLKELKLSLDRAGVSVSFGESGSSRSREPASGGP